MMTYLAGTSSVKWVFPYWYLWFELEEHKNFRSSEKVIYNCLGIDTDCCPLISNTCRTGSKLYSISRIVDVLMLWEQSLRFLRTKGQAPPTLMICHGFVSQYGFTENFSGSDKVRVSFMDKGLNFKVPGIPTFLYRVSSFLWSTYLFTHHRYIIMQSAQHSCIHTVQIIKMCQLSFHPEVLFIGRIYWPTELAQWGDKNNKPNVGV